MPTSPLRHAAFAQMPRRQAASEFVAAVLPEREALLDPILASNSLALLYGPRGLGKRFAALSIARAAASGGSFLGWQSRRPHRVLYIDGDMAARDLKRRLLLLGDVPAKAPPPATGGLTAETMAEVEAAAVLKAKGGSVPAMVIVERMWRHRERPINLDLPLVTSAESLADAQAEVIAAVARDRITPQHGVAFTRMLDGRRRALELLRVMRALDALEQANADRLAVERKARRR
jgi:AAA domain-containing protein